ncbi:MAG: DNA polymerase III subunit delta [Prevotellaceae bacterium]|jgi:DNA polymerase-3 subunit delta'|nr:DNA polymerase III subunit delta [Prevotellaceae bacterium]
MLFKDVVGQDELKKKLVATVTDNRISHAQLFEGFAGYGGLPLSIAYAQFISCTNRTATDSCGTCPSCVKYSKLIHPDLHFVFPVNKTAKTEKEKDRQISDLFLQEWRNIVLQKKYFSEMEWYNAINLDVQGLIRIAEADSIMSKLKLTACESSMKIMIIWLPERMRREVANSLLKLIEEPPKETLFLLVTEHADEVLPTIYSRTQRIKLLPLDEKDTARALINDGYSEKDAADASRLCEGNYLNAKKILTASEAEKEYFELFVTLMRLAHANRILELLDWAENAAKLSKEKQKAFLVYAERMFRENYILSINPNIVYLNSAELEWSGKFYRYIKTDCIHLIYRHINDCIPQLAQNGNAKIIFTDLALKIRMCID